MSTRQKTALFILVPTIVMFLCAPCKSSALSTSPAQVVKEFVKASKEADFKKIAELSCKDSGLYPTLEDAQKLDMSNFGFIEEVIREETCEVDPEGLKIVVARLSFLGKMDFLSFLVFKTEKGWKVHISGDILRKYPIGELSILKTATDFYISNKIKLDVGLRTAQKIVDLETNDARNHHILGYVYQLKESLEDDKGLKESLTEKKFYEFTQTLKFDKHYAEKHLNKQALIIVWKRLLDDPDKELKYYAADKLYEIGEKQSVPILMEKWQNIFEESKWDSTLEHAANQLAEIGGKDSVPFLCKALEVKKAVYVIAHLLGKLGDNRAVPSLIKALDTNDFNTATKVIEALGKIGDKRAEPALKTILEKELGKKLSIWSSSERAEAILYSLDKVTGEKWSNSFMEEKGKIFYPNSILNKINGMFSDIHMWGTKKVDCDILGERLDPSNPNYNRLRQWICERWIKRCPSFNCQKALIKNLNELELVFRIETRDKREYLDTASLTLKKSGNKWNIVDVKEGLPAEEASLKKATHASEDRKTHSEESRNKLTPYDCEKAKEYYKQANSIKEAIGDIEKKISLCKKAIELCPDFPGAHDALGSTYKHKGMYDDAKREYKEALRIDPNYYQAHINLGFFYMEQGRYNDAILEFDEGLRINPNNAVLRYFVGKSYSDHGMHDDAVREGGSHGVTPWGGSHGVMGSHLD